MLILAISVPSSSYPHCWNFHQTKRLLPASTNRHLSKFTSIVYSTFIASTGIIPQKAADLLARRNARNGAVATLTVFERLSDKVCKRI